MKCVHFKALVHLRVQDEHFLFTFICHYDIITHVGNNFLWCLQAGTITHVGNIFLWCLQAGTSVGSSVGQADDGRQQLGCRHGSTHPACRAPSPRTVPCYGESQPSDPLVTVLNINVTLVCCCKALLLTHYGLVTPYGARDLGQHWLR